MNINQNGIRVLYWGGTAYLLINIIILIVLSILSAQTDTPDSLTSILSILTIPAAGIISGYWLRSNTISWWKIILIAISLLIYLSILFTAVFISPKLDKLKQDKYTQNIDAEINSQKLEKIFQALYTNDTQTAHQLLDAGVDVSLRNDTGQTLLHVAQDPNIVKRLILAGADVNAIDSDGQSPIFNKNIESLKIIVDAGADIHMKNLNGGNTTLIWFSYSGYTEGIAYLVSKGADINSVNLDENTALDIAQRFGHVKLEAYLKSIGAKTGKTIK